MGTPTTQTQTMVPEGTATNGRPCECPHCHNRGGRTYFMRGIGWVCWDCMKLIDEMLAEDEREARYDRVHIGV